MQFNKVITVIRCEWIKVSGSSGLSVGAKDRLYSVCVHSFMLNENETWPIKEEDGIRLKRNGAGKVRRIFNVRPENWIVVEELRTRLKLNSVRKCLQDGRLQWFAHQERMGENAWSSEYRTLKVSVNFPRGRPRKTWNEAFRSDLKVRKVSKVLQ